MRENGFIGLVLVLITVAALVVLLVGPDQATRKASQVYDNVRRQTNEMVTRVAELIDGDKFDGRRRKIDDSARGRLDDIRRSFRSGRD